MAGPGVAAFIDAEGRVVSSTDDRHAVGQALPFSSQPGIIEMDGANYSVASVAASGYREFKNADGYTNGVRAVVALRLGALERRRMALFDRSLRPLPSRPPRRVRELAVFQVGPGRYACPCTRCSRPCRRPAWCAWPRAACTWPDCWK